MIFVFVCLLFLLLLTYLFLYLLFLLRVFWLGGGGGGWGVGSSFEHLLFTALRPFTSRVNANIPHYYSTNSHYAHIW